MKTKLFFLFFLSLIALHAQTTHQIFWTFGVSGPAGSLNISQGDTVEWIWDDDFATHTVTSTGGVETLNSGFHSGLGYVYSHTFNNIGSTDYQCDVHPGTMNGTITVAPLSIDDFALKGFSIYPNPTKDELILQLPNGLDKASIDIFDMLGKHVYNDDLTRDPINISTWSKGVYDVRVTSENIVQTKRFIKQ